MCIRVSLTVVVLIPGVGGGILNPSVEQVKGEAAVPHGQLVCILHLQEPADEVFINIRAVLVSVAVSYTHLDVYKRQVALLAFGVWSLTSYLTDKSLQADLALISASSTAATPPPPNRGGKGTQTTSKTLYNKKGYRIDVENPGNRTGQIHLQKGSTKYYYNVKDQAFHIGSCLLYTSRCV